MATEVPSCSQTDHGEINIISFMKKNSDKEFIQQLYQEWNSILVELQIMDTMRRKMDGWFLDVYRSREAVKTMEKEELHNILKSKENELYESFKQGIEEQIEDIKGQGENDAVIKYLNLQSKFEEVESNWSPLEWVKNAVKCVEKEAELIRKYSMNPLDVEMCEAEKKMDADIALCESLNKDLENTNHSMDQKLAEYVRVDQQIQQEQENLKNLELVLQSDKFKKNGVSLDPRRQQMENTIAQLTEHRTEVGNDFCKKMDCIRDKIVSSIPKLEAVVCEIEQEIKEWKRQFQFDYAQIEAYPKLDRIAPWCEKVGKILEKAKGHCFEAQRLYESAGAKQAWETECMPSSNTLAEIQHRFFQSSFVVVEQEDFVIKVDKKNFPKISVRFLAAEGLDLNNCKITAHFVYEDHIQLLQDGHLDLQLIQDKEKKIKGETAHFHGSQKGKLKQTFSGMHFKDKDFTRGDSANNRMIHEQKYRVVFVTHFKEQEYWTLSLPLVVTTGANQGCRALASIMWQCYGTDVYQVPIQRRDELPWCEFAKMVNQKVRRLCSQKNYCPIKELSEENVAHLKNRMFGGAQVPDDEMVSLNKFCYDKMYNTKDEQCFTFWKWFLANYNLLEKYLFDYWKNGLIEGFLSKEDCQRKFKTCGNHKNGLFILRFSDQHIDDSQGIKNIFGHLVAEVSSVKENKEGQKYRNIFHLDVGGHSKLKNKNLANLLRETEDKHHKQVYQYVFPGRSTREQAFDSFCENGNIVEGYEGPHDAFIVDLEHAVCKLELSTGKHRSPSLDSGFDAASPASVCSTAGKVEPKRMRSVENAHPTLTKMLATKSIGSPAMSDISHLSSPQPSPAFSAASPAESRGKYMSDVLIHQQPSPSFDQVLEPLDPMNLPKFDDIQPDASGSRYNTRNRNNSSHSQSGNQAGPQNCSGVQDATSGFYNISSPPANEVVIEECPAPDNEEIVIYVNGTDFNTSSANQTQATSFMNQTSPMISANQNVCLEQDPYQAEQAPANCAQQLIDILKNLPPDQQRQIIHSVQACQTRPDVMSPEPAHDAMCTDNNPDDIQAVNSSGSLFNFNVHEISEANQMDSGSIDPNVLDKFGDDPQSY